MRTRLDESSKELESAHSALATVAAGDTSERSETRDDGEEGAASDEDVAELESEVREDKVKEFLYCVPVCLTVDRRAPAMSFVRGTDGRRARRAICFAI